jgi:hypothetical protein
MNVSADQNNWSILTKYLHNTIKDDIFVTFNFYKQNQHGYHKTLWGENMPFTIPQLYPELDKFSLVQSLYYAVYTRSFKA